MGNLSELNAVEKPVTEWLSKMGWTHKSTSELKVGRVGFYPTFLTGVPVEIFFM